jgi:pimeloyl-ACP methyl ester carboxylesterase
MAALLAGPASLGAESVVAERDTVVLMHGLGRSASSMEPLAKRLREAGFETHNLDYPSTEHTSAELVDWLAEALDRCCDDGRHRLNFVTHSLGGILVRAQLERSRPSNLARVVLIAPPNKGSEIVDNLGDNPVFEAVLGPTAPELGTEPDSFPNRIGPPDYELGIIAGTESINPVGSAMLPGPDDGTVSIEGTKLEGAADFLLVEANHTFIMQEEEVGRQVIHFLRTGRFDHAKHSTPDQESAEAATTEEARAEEVPVEGRSGEGAGE